MLPSPHDSMKKRTRQKATFIKMFSRVKNLFALVMLPSSMPSGLSDITPHSTRGVKQHEVLFDNMHSGSSSEGILCGDLRRKEYTLLFLHFQKCGGTSVEKALKKFAIHCKLGYARLPRDSWRTRLSSGKLTFLTGHIPYGVHSYLKKTNKYDYVGIFRDPIERAWSQYQHNGKRRCKCTFEQFSKSKAANYYQFKLCGDISRKSLNLAIINLRQVTLVQMMYNLETWFKDLQVLLQSKSSLPIRLPKLQAFNVRNTTSALLLKRQGKTGTVYNTSDFDSLRSSASLRELHANDYVILEELHKLLR